jgi:hypothetical protein
MNKNKYVAPWRRIVCNGIHQTVVDANGETVAFDIQGLANAQPIANAPLLLESAKEAHSAMLRRYDAGEEGDFWNDAMAQLRAAIAAAEACPVLEQYGCLCP